MVKDIIIPIPLDVDEEAPTNRNFMVHEDFGSRIVISDKWLKSTFSYRYAELIDGEWYPSKTFTEVIIKKEVLDHMIISYYEPANKMVISSGDVDIAQASSLSKIREISEIIQNWIDEK